MEKKDNHIYYDYMSGSEFLTIAGQGITLDLASRSIGNSTLWGSRIREATKEEEELFMLKAKEQGREIHFISHYQYYNIF